MEVFVKIKGFEGYEISNLGNVKSLKNGNCKILKTRKDKFGYLRVNLYLEHGFKTLMIHKLVAFSFLNHPLGKSILIVDHIDNDKLNNKLDNLQLISCRENSSKDKKNKTSKHTGVSWDKVSKKWRCSIFVKGKVKNLGRFEKETDASSAYKNICRNIEQFKKIIE